MTAQSRTVLKSYFQTGLRPTQTQYANLIDSFELVSGVSSFLPITGGIMTGAIQLPGVPTSALAAANKGYVDAIVSAGGIVIGGANTQVQYNNAGVLGGFTVSGDAASLATTGVLTLATTGVSAGTYATPTITVDAKGRITSASTASSTAIKTVSKQIFTSSGTYTPSAGMAFCIIELVGGGADGGVGAANSGAGGGGAGGYARLLATAATIGASKTVTIGAAAGTSSLGALVSATGGTAAIAASGITNGGNPGGIGGAGSSGDVNMAGAVGTSGINCSTAGNSMGGNGGDSYFGGGGKGGFSTTGTAAAANSGAGGGGTAGSASSGGAGGTGFMIITEFLTV